VIASTQRLAEILGDDDSLGVVVFSTGARTVSPLRKLSADARRQLHAEVAGLQTEGSTNIAGGLAHATLLFPARTPGERHLALLLSDGQPNVGADTPEALAAETRLIKQKQIAVSTLGFGASHNEDVLIAIGDAGGGRYAFVDDPKLASSSFARALGAQRDVVAEDIELQLSPAPGVEIARVLGDPPTRFGAGGLKVSLADAIAGDELNIVVELKLEAPRESGPWRALGVTLDARRAVSREAIALHADVAVTITSAGPFDEEPEARVAVAVARADELRTEARALADRRNFQGAAAILKRAQRLIADTQGFQPGASGPLNDAYETLVDEIAAMERVPDPEQYAAFRKASLDYAGFATHGTRVTSTGASKLDSAQAKMLVEQMIKSGALPRAQFVVLDGPLKGAVFEAAPELDIGRTHDSSMMLDDPTVSRRHARVVCLDGKYWIVDLGSSGGLFVNDRRVNRHCLAHGDVIRIGRMQVRYEILPPPN
jgi:hypothetical protein